MHTIEKVWSCAFEGHEHPTEATAAECNAGLKAEWLRGSGRAELRPEAIKLWRAEMNIPYDKARAIDPIKTVLEDDVNDSELGASIFRRDEPDPTAEGPPDGNPIVAMIEHNETVYLATTGSVYRMIDGVFHPVLFVPLLS